jgi:hypothetical protein
VRIDVDAVALQPVGAGLCALVNRHRDPGAVQALREAEAADAAADDHDVELLRSGHADKSHSSACFCQLNI